MTRVDQEQDEWPHGVVTAGEGVMAVLAEMTHTPEVIIVDGGATHPTTATKLRARHMHMWGRVRSKATHVWMLRMETRTEAVVYESSEEMAEELDRAMQSRMRKAYGSMGAQRFKGGVQAEDFSLAKVREALAVQSYEEWGERWSTEQLQAATFWEWPKEPDTTEAKWNSPELTGLEVEDQLDENQRQERQADLELWKREGQTWWGAFLPATRDKVQAFLDGNKTANDAVAEEVSKHTVPGTPGPKYSDALPERGNELTVTQAEYRPGARGRIWTWQSGSCEECLPVSVEKEIAAAAGFSAERLKEVAAILKFPDKRAVQMAAETGATHGTKDFPLTSYAGRNHQGSGVHHAIVTQMMTGKVRDSHFEIQDGETEPWLEHPNCHPFGVVPMGGTVQRQKELEAYETERDGGAIDKNVRGTYNGSFPHDGSSPNDHCNPDPDTQKPWVTVRNVVRGAAILNSIGAPAVKFFKLDLKAAYTQLLHQVTQRWRQIIYWRWKVNGEWCGGFMQDKRMEWGMANSGNVFHRAVTCVMVRWIEKVLLEEWMPTLECKITKKWVKARLQQGHVGQQGVPGFVHGFLDDYWFFLAGTEGDIERAKDLIMAAFEHVGFTISASKLETEGTPEENGVILGHEIDLGTGTRGVTEYKKVRIRDQVRALGEHGRWNRKLLESLLGLIQSIRGDVRRRWRLDPLYALLRRRGEMAVSENVKITNRAQKVLQKVLDTLDERQLLAARATRWVIPTAPTVEGIANTDASSLVGYGGAMVMDGLVLYFAGKWSKQIREGTVLDGVRSPLVDIACLEALTVIVAAATWGHLWSGRKVVLRSDSSPTVFCFNKLASKDPTMARIADLWEDVQFHYGFEGLLVHCKGRTNELADRASRLEEQKLQSGMEEAAKMEGVGPKGCKRVPAKWSFGTETIEIMEELIALTEEAGRQRKRKRSNKCASPPTPPHPYTHRGKQGNRQK